MVPHLEYLWQDCNDEEEAMKNDHSILTLPQIYSLKFQFQLEGVVEDGLYIVEPGWQEVSELK